MFSSLKVCRQLRQLYAADMSSFIQRLNPMTGQNDWVVQNEEYDYHQEIARAAFADMLHDEERNVMYEKALKCAIDHVHSCGRKANVLDIGTGTGLLSMMAVRHGADTVVACEAFGPMSKCALEVIKLNGYSDRIKVIPKRSTDLKVGVDLDIRANILVTEVFDTELIGEGAFSTFKHAHDCLLEKDCVVVPHSATIYAQIVESPLVTSWNRVKDIYNEEGELLLKAPRNIAKCRGSATLHDLQLNQTPMEYLKILSEPQPVLRFDWSGKTPFVYKRSTINTVRPERDGKAQAVLMWWDLNMDIENKLVLSCAPFWTRRAKKGAVPWRDHWMQAVYYLPAELPVRTQEEVHLVSCHDEYSLWFNLKSDLQITDVDYNCPECTCGLHIVHSRTQIGMMNDARRTKKYLSVIENHVDENSNVLLIGRGFYAGLVAAKKAARVIYLESNALSQRLLRDFVAANDLNNVDIVGNVGDIKEVINVVLGEPYFSSSILPWHNLYFKYLLKELKPHLAEDVKVFPRMVRVRGVAVQFDDLHKIRLPLGECQGFKMEPFDKLIEASMEISDDTVEAQPLWEYPCKALSDVKDIFNMNLTAANEPSLYENKIVFNTDSVGLCNGVALWVDWIFDENNPLKMTISTGPTTPFEVGNYISWDMHTRQGVCLLGHRKLNKEFTCSFNFDCVGGNMSFSIDL